MPTFGGLSIDSPRAAVAVADAQLARHRDDDPADVAARRGVIEERLVLLPHRVPVDAVIVRRIEEIAIEPPGLAQDLPPFGARVDHDRDVFDRHGSRRFRFDLGAGWRDLEALALSQQQLLAVRRNEVGVDAGRQRLGRALLHHEALQLTGTVERADGRCGWRPQVIQLAALARLQAAQRRAAGGQGHDAIADAVEVDGGCGAARRLCRSLSLARQRRRIALAQHDRVERMRESQVERRQREPVLHRPGLLGGDHVQVAAAAIEHRLAHFGEAVGDAERLALRDRVHVHDLDQAVAVLRVREPLRVRRPVVRDERRVAEVVVLGDARRAARFELEHVQAVRIVEERHALLIGRPLEIAIEAGAAARSRCAAAWQLPLRSAT